jgi:sugar lactone lactonase YvrE
MAAIERLTEQEYAVGECPVWRAAEGALYWVDITARRIHRLHIDSGNMDTWRADEMVACMAFERGGALIAGMESGLFSLDLEGGGTISSARLAVPAFPMTGMRFNDGRCDRQGRFWAGTMHMDMPAAHAVGALYRYSDREGLAGPFEVGLLTQNGLAWSPEGDRMYLSDSHPKARTIWVYDYDRAAGLASGRRVFVDMNQHSGRPDGAAIDVDGGYWTCANDGAQVLRFTPEGKLDKTIALPVPKPSMCAFGGADMETLFVTSIGGPVFAVRPGNRGMPETEYGTLN